MQPPYRFTAAVLITLATPAAADHGFAVKYDRATQIEIAGTVSMVSYVNPHVFITVQTPSGAWTVETEGVSVVNGKGLNPTALKPGTSVKARGWPARDGSPELGLSAISIAGGPDITLRDSID